MLANIVLILLITTLIVCIYIYYSLYNYEHLALEQKEFASTDIFLNLYYDCCSQGGDANECYIYARENLEEIIKDDEDSSYLINNLPDIHTTNKIVNFNNYTSRK